MEIRKLISKFLTQLCEKNYSQANESLNHIVEAKTKKEIEKVVKGKKGSKKLSPAQKKIAAAAAPYEKITGADFKELKNKKVSKKGSK
jgi:hypothetical protein